MLPSAVKNQNPNSDLLDQEKMSKTAEYSHRIHHGPQPGGRDDGIAIREAGMSTTSW